MSNVTLLEHDNAPQVNIHGMREMRICSEYSLTIELPRADDNRLLPWSNIILHHVSVEIDLCFHQAWAKVTLAYFRRIPRTEFIVSTFYMAYIHPPRRKLMRI